jgi:phage terminase large subunit-like protein
MEVSLHEKQSIVFNDPHRYKVVAAGRRFGKSFLAAVLLYIEASKTHKTRSDGSEIDLINEVVYYVGPTFKQARENLWAVCMELGQGLIKGVRQNEGEIQLTNGRIIRFKGADDPDSLRGVGLSFVVMDEYAFMKPSVWEYIIRPALGRAEGGAMFIGTPAGKNHFYEMWNSARTGVDPSSGKESKDWKAFQFTSSDNPHLTQTEIDAMYASTSEEAQKQELEASFEATGGKVFTYDQFPIVACQHPGAKVLACDLAGFSAPEGKNKSKQVLDDHALCIVRVHERGYHIERIIHGKWDVRETALRIVKAWRDWQCDKMGIEQGMAKNAVAQFIYEYQEQFGTYFEIHPLRHMNNRKEDRIKWALQGRADKGQITLEPDDKLPPEDKWVNKFLGQAVDFPNPLAHDDLIDSAAYAIDQLAELGMGWQVDVYDEWEPLDDLAGY